MQQAMIPMLLSMVLGVGRDDVGAGEAGMVIMGAGHGGGTGADGAFTRVQESTADQIALKLLLATHQSPHGHLSTRLSASPPRKRSGAYKIDPFAVDHPVGQDRLADMQAGVMPRPRSDVKDRPRSPIRSRWCRPSWRVSPCR